MKTKVNITVAYASLKSYKVIDLCLVTPCTIEVAIDRSGIIELFPEIDLTQQAVGVFSQRKQLSDLVQAGDRIEIYRPLLIDPKTARKNRAAKKS